MIEKVLMEKQRGGGGGEYQKIMVKNGKYEL